MAFTSASMFWSFLLCSCTCSLFISMTNSRDSCSDSQNAPGLPWACRQRVQTLEQQQVAPCPARPPGGVTWMFLCRSLWKVESWALFFSWL